MKELSEQTHYEVLEISPGCSAAAVGIAYEKQKARLGPDSLATYALLGPGEIRLMLARIEDAYAVLIESARRRDYDRGLGFPPPAPEVTETPREEIAEPSAATPTPEALHALAVPTEEKAVAPIEASLPATPEVAAPPPAISHESFRDDAEKPIRRTEAELPADAPITGDALRRVREALGYSLKDLAARTKIGHWHLDNIERERHAELPAQVYLRGFLTSLARELKLDPQRVARGYLEHLTKGSRNSKPP